MTQPMLDLSAFYHHALSYETYVILAYGVVAVMLSALMVFVVRGYLQVKRDLRKIEGVLH